MATAMVSAAFSVVGKALAPFTDSLLKDWAASKNLGSNVRALELELLSVKALLEHALGREIHNSALKDLVLMLQDLGYDAEDVLDEMDYFRIQDELDGTFSTADKHTKGCAHDLALHAKAVGKQILCLPSCLAATTPEAKRKAPNSNAISSAPHNNQANQEVNGYKSKIAFRACNPIHAIGKHFPCSSLPSVRDDDDDDDSENSMHSSPQRNDTNEQPKLRFNRVNASTRMQHIVDQLQRVRGNVSSIITTLGSNWSTIPTIAESRITTTSESIETRLYGRDLIMNSIIQDITKSKHFSEALTVIPIVGPGGIGKTTLAQHIYHSGQVKEHFDVKVWTCVSLNFNVNKLIEEIGKHIPKVDSESTIGTAGELIGQRLKNKRFLLVLDDMWDCSNEDEWKQLLQPFKKSQVQGNIILITTRFPAQAQITVQKIDHSTYLQGLDHKEFKDLFLYFVFGEDQCRKDHTFLLETGDKIVCKLKGSPLAAKTVGRLLKKQLDLVHWTRVLESKEWEQSDSNNDIMPALKLSYDYLPSQLQQCFSYCALFPQDYKFEREELINVWIGLDVLHSSRAENKRVEDIGLGHLTQLVNHGFFEERKNDGGTFYILHDLLHELAQKVSSHECLSIYSSKVKGLPIPPSIRHLSINIDETSIEGRLSIKNCLEEFYTLDKRLKVEKLRSLMLFGEQHGCFVKAFGDLFSEAKALRVVFLSGASYDVEDLLRTFYNLVHLRYLRVQSSSLGRTRFPRKISRFYHMLVLDTKYCGIDNLPRDMSNLTKLRHFLVQNDATHSRIVEVGRLKSLQELRRFVVNQEGQGFELRQIGDLVQLCGSLSITNLENIEATEEADEAKLMQKSHLHELILCWDIGRSTNDSALEEHVLERFKPSSNLLKLSIIGHRGATCPSWLGTNLSIRSLASLYLDGVAWKIFPPIGDLWLDNVCHVEISGKIHDKRFENLRRLGLFNLPRLKKWVVDAPCQLFPLLKVLSIQGCSELVELSISHSDCCQQEKEAYANWFPRLSELRIGNCTKLSSFPPVPWTSNPCSISINGIGRSCLGRLVCENNSRSEYNLTIEENGTPDSTFWNVLAFQNLTKLKYFDMKGCQPPSLRHLQMLSSLQKLDMSCSSSTFPFEKGDSHVEYQFPVEELCIGLWSASGKELTQLLTYFPKLSELTLWSCEKITRLGVMGQQATATPGPSTSANKLDQKQDTRAEELVALSAEEGMLLLPPQLQELSIGDCPQLRLFSKQGGLQGLTSLRRLNISDCPKLLSFYSSSSTFSSVSPFPKSLEYLNIYYEVGIETLAPLANLISLTSLYIRSCGDLRGGGLLSLLTQGQLTKLSVRETPNFFIDSEPSQVHEQELTSHSSKLQELCIDDVAGVTAAPICCMLFSSLSTLEISEDKEMERFTEEQEALLFANSLEEIRFLYCERLKDLPARLHSLLNLKRLLISCCGPIEMLHGLPSSLQELEIYGCSKIRSLSMDHLPSSLQKLRISDCRAIRLVPMPKVDDLPCSLRELDVKYSNSEELKRQCRKFIGIVPIVKVDD